MPSLLADEISTWFRAEARDLPWRRPDTTPWGVLVSEFMLQQTPVARVEPVWLDWMARWPVPSALAAAPRADVLRAWGKLGYPRRAIRLHDAAAAIASDHGDEVPSDVETLEALPGIGSYTARAVAAFGHGLRAAVVDTNVRRVVARAVHGAGDAGPARTRADLADVDALLPHSDAEAAVASAGLMELGAVVCTARASRCGLCPVSARCAWVAAGRPEYTGPRKPVQGFAGTDRQVRGKLLDVLRGSQGPVPRAALDAVWSDAGQRDRCLDSLLVDGLAEQTGDGRFALPAGRPDAVPHVVRFRLDDDAVAALEALRGSVLEAGAEPTPDRPQVTVAAAGTIPAPTRDALVADLRLLSLPTLWLAALGSLPGDDEHLVLAAVVTDPEVLAVHSAVHDVLAGRVRSPHAAHLPGSWLPHCVLARSRPAAAFAALHPVVPVRARIVAVELHDTRTGSVDTLRSTT